MEPIRLPDNVRQIIQVLDQHGHEAYAVGGCIRDSILGRTPNDWDITTSASPQEVKALFRKTFDTGIAHGTVTVLEGGGSYEVTTYRIDGEYHDGRHPDHVTFTSSLREDLARRDFTINAMAYNETDGLQDLFGGREDLEKKRIRAVGVPAERFEEDALRMLRAVRFGAQLGFSIEEETAEAIRAMAGRLRMISAERIHAELEKLVVSDHPEDLQKAYELGITAVILPEFDRLMNAPQNNAHHIWNVGLHTIHAMMAAPPDRVLRFAMLFHDIGKPDSATVDEQGIYHYKGHAEASARLAENIMRRLKFDNDTLRKVKTLIAWHSCYPEESGAGVRTAAARITPELFPLFLQVKRADILAQSPAVRERKLSYLDRIESIYAGALERGDCLRLADLALTGNDLIADGMKRGPQIGMILQALFEDVLRNPQDNSREILLERARRLRSGEQDAGQA